MATSQVSYLTKSRLTCGCVYGAGVILGCSNSLTVPNSEGDSPHFVDATIMSEQAVSNNVFGQGWGYVFSYDDSQIKDGQVFLSGSITSVTCKSGLTQWVLDNILLNSESDTVTLSLTAANILDAVVIDFGDITTSFVVTGFLDSTQQARWIRIVNESDANIWLSANGTDDHFYVQLLSEEILPFGQNYEFMSATNLWLRSETSAPLTGRVIIYGWY